MLALVAGLVVLGGSVSVPRAVFASPAADVAPAVPVTGSSLVVAETVCLGADLATCGTLPPLLRSRLSAAGFDVRNPGPTPPCADSTCAVALAKNVGARWAVTLLAVRLDGAVVLDVSLVDATSGRVEHNERTRIATMGDLDPLSARLAKALSERVPFASTMTSKNVTNAEARPWAVRRRPNILLGAQLTGMTPIGGFGGVGYLSGGEATAWLEVDQWLVQGSVGSNHGQRGETSVNESYADAGVFRVFGDGEMAPIAGGGIGARGIEMSDNTPNEDGETWERGSGNALWASGGVMMLRTTQINVFVLGKYSVDLFSIPGHSAPHGLTLSAGAAYRF